MLELYYLILVLQITISVLEISSVVARVLSTDRTNLI
jgi:hypothetical protein